MNGSMQQQKPRIIENLNFEWYNSIKKMERYNEKVLKGYLLYAFKWNYLKKKVALLH